MMKKMTRSIKIFLFIITVITILVKPAFAYELERYYPLGQGDGWTYTVIDDEEIEKETLKIEGEETIDGKNTVKISSDDDDYEFIGIDPEGVKIYKDFGEDGYEIYNPPMMNIPRIAMGENSEYSFARILYDLKRNKIEESNNIIKITLEAIKDVEVAAGKFSGCLKYRSIREERKESHDFTEREICTVWLAPNVGMVKEVCVGDEYNEEEKKMEISTQKSELISAIIGGKKIGNP